MMVKNGTCYGNVCKVIVIFIDNTYIYILLVQMSAGNWFGFEDRNNTLEKTISFLQ